MLLRYATALPPTASTAPPIGPKSQTIYLYYPFLLAPIPISLVLFHPYLLLLLLTAQILTKMLSWMILRLKQRHPNHSQPPRMIGSNEPRQLLCPLCPSLGIFTDLHDFRTHFTTTHNKLDALPHVSWLQQQGLVLCPDCPTLHLSLGERGSRQHITRSHPDTCPKARLPNTQLLHTLYMALNPSDSAWASSIQWLYETELPPPPYRVSLLSKKLHVPDY
jgi:hypothetical protein